MKIGLLCALSEEIALLSRDIVADKTTTIAGRHFHEGKLYGHDVVLAMSGVGKVAATLSTTLLITNFEVDCVVFSGTAGALDADLQVGDIVVADRLVQHDFSVDETPTFRIPIINKSYFLPDKVLSSAALHAAQQFIIESNIDTVMQQTWNKFLLTTPKVLQGTIASGDCFVRAQETKQKLCAQITELRCVEMEGAATAQVCEDFLVPYAIVRVMSDRADEKASISFATFAEHLASHMVAGIMKNLLPMIG